MSYFSKPGTRHDRTPGCEKLRRRPTRGCWVSKSQASLAAVKNRSAASGLSLAMRNPIPRRSLQTGDFTTRFIPDEYFVSMSASRPQWVLLQKP